MNSRNSQSYLSIERCGYEELAGMHRVVQSASDDTFRIDLDSLATFETKMFSLHHISCLKNSSVISDSHMKSLFPGLI